MPSIDKLTDMRDALVTFRNFYANLPVHACYALGMTPPEFTVVCQRRVNEISADIEYFNYKLAMALRPKKIKCNQLFFYEIEKLKLW